MLQPAPPRPSSHAGVTLQPCWRPPPCSLDIMTHADLRAFAWLASWPRAPLSLILSSAHPSPRLSALLAQCPPPSSCRANAPHPPGCPQSPAHPVERLGKTVVPISQVRKSRLRGRGQRSDRERHLEAPPHLCPAPHHQGKGISFCSGGCGVLGQLVGRLTGLGACVCGSGSWGSWGPTPTQSVSGRWGRGSSSWRLALCQLGTSAGWGCPGTVSLSLSFGQHLVLSLLPGWHPKMLLSAALKLVKIHCLAQVSFMMAIISVMSGGRLTVNS